MRLEPPARFRIISVDVLCVELAIGTSALWLRICFCTPKHTVQNLSISAPVGFKVMAAITLTWITHFPLDPVPSKQKIRINREKTFVS